MAKRKNSFEALENIKVEGANNNTNTMEVVDMNELNKEMVETQINTLKGEVIDMHENMENCLESGLVEDANELHTEIVVAEEMIVELENKLDEEYDIASDKEDDKELLSLYAHKLKIDGAIHYAVKQGALKYAQMVEKGEETPKFVSNKQIQGIIKNYELRTGVEMTTKQINFIKTLNPIQIEYIGITLNKARNLAMA
ncbi:hypothetical protein [Romboutsia sp.]|uniref:hypothetical protein n=1 Tax=Romboutsia sp. TaxID=1965302 RepID=UPI002CD00CBD|nr:hypothetical protein [Romboutsia sp.]HSQ90207.1 hypothetical protein [Romboutsia sp.]